MELREHQSLAEITSLQIGGEARWYVEVHSTDEIREALMYATSHALRWTILGAGMSTLAPDTGFDGLVLRCVGPVRQHLHAGGLSFAGDVLGNAGSVAGLALHTEIPVDDILEYHWMTEQGGVQVIPSRQWATSGLQFAKGVLLGIVPKHDISAPIEHSHPPLPTARVFLPQDGTAASSIADVGWAGKPMGKVQLWAEDPTWLLPNAGATADEVVQLMSLVKQQVRDTLGVQLRDALSYLGM